MLKLGENRLCIPPTASTQKNVMKPSTYMIDNLDGDNFLIHRQIQKSEDMNELDSDLVFEYDGNSYIFLTNVRTEEEAQEAIKSYWLAFKELSFFG